MTNRTRIPAFYDHLGAVWDIGPLSTCPQQGARSASGRPPCGPREPATVTSSWQPLGRDNPTTAAVDVRPHEGIDLRADVGTEVLAPAPGYAWLVDRSPDGGGGRILYYETTLGLLPARLIYMHLERIELAHLQRAELGDVIALTGQSGRVTGPHLHLEVWIKLGGDSGRWVCVDPVACWTPGTFEVKRA